MKTRGFKDLWLPRRLAFHVKILLGSLFTTLMFMPLLRAQFTPKIFFDMFPLVFIQFEIFIWMGQQFFPDNLKVGKSARQVVTQTLLRLLLFYLAVLITAVSIFFLSMYLRTLFSGADFVETLNYFIHHEWGGFIASVSSGLLFGIIIFFFSQWRDALDREQKLREEKMLFRYETLKNQVNPHFLFNSFNTLASLVDQHPEQAEIFISKLSSIYRYILEKQELDWVPLAEELEFARNYFELQKIRDGEKVDVEIRVPEPEKYEVMPISLQILLENVFKHNVASRDHPLVVTIQLDSGGYLLVTNPLRPKTTLGESTGTGLRNLGERTRLLTGKDIRIIEKPDAYSVRIPLKNREQ